MAMLIAVLIRAAPLAACRSTMWRWVSRSPPGGLMHCLKSDRELLAASRVFINASLCSGRNQYVFAKHTTPVCTPAAPRGGNRIGLDGGSEMGTVGPAQFRQAA